MQHTTVFDIETSLREDAANFIESPEAPSNWKDKQKIEAYIQEKTAQQLERGALDAITARVLCVGILRDDEAPLFIGETMSDCCFKRRGLYWECKRHYSLGSTAPVLIGLCLHGVLTFWVCGPPIGFSQMADGSLNATWI